jgi:catechol 2,3-dioxygenase-like lactoylglutathione lyase family enzyme
MTVFNHIGLCVTDLARSRRFYEEVLGFVFERDLAVPDAPSDRLVRVEAPLGMTAVYLRRDSFVLELLHFDRPGNPAAVERVMNEPGLTHLSVSVDDIAATCSKVETCGGTVLPDTNVGAGVFVRDPDGQLIELLSMEYLRPR